MTKKAKEKCMQIAKRCKESFSYTDQEVLAEETANAVHLSCAEARHCLAGQVRKGAGGRQGKEVHRLWTACRLVVLF